MLEISVWLDAWRGVQSIDGVLGIIRLEHEIVFSVSSAGYHHGGAGTAVGVAADLLTIILFDGSQVAVHASASLVVFVIELHVLFLTLWDILELCGSNAAFGSLALLATVHILCVLFELIEITTKLIDTIGINEILLSLISSVGEALDSLALTLCFFSLLTLSFLE